MAWYATQKRTRKRTYERYIFLYIYMEMHRACVVNPVTSMAHFTGLLFSKGDRIQPLGLNKQVIVCRFSFVCVHVGAYMHAHTYASFSRQKCCCRRLPESGTLPIPAGFRMLKRNTGARTHRGVHAHLWTSVMTVHRLS